jgi:cytochrome b6-f complex iron-sulfur subunit
MNYDHEPRPRRRDFLGLAAFWTTVSTLLFAALGIARMPKPGVFPGQTSEIKVGAPGEYPISAEPQRVPGQNLYILHEHDGFAALAALCPHLGCIVAATSDGFDCPCHGSKFSRDGRVSRGPAPSALAWYALDLAPDGQLIVNTKKTVPVGTKQHLA